MTYVSVMEVACGEYGDVVPQLVVAVKSNKCSPFQNPSTEAKVINPEKAVRDKNSVDAKFCLVTDDKTVGFDSNLQTLVEMKISKLLGEYEDLESDENNTLKNDKLAHECSGTYAKQVMYCLICTRMTQ